MHQRLPFLFSVSVREFLLCHVINAHGVLLLIVITPTAKHWDHQDVYLGCVQQAIQIVHQTSDLRASDVWWIIWIAC